MPPKVEILEENETVFTDGDDDPETKTEVDTLEFWHRLIEETAAANDAATVPCWLSVVFLGPACWFFLVFNGQLAGFLFVFLRASFLVLFFEWPACWLHLFF